MSKAHVFRCGEDGGSVEFGAGKAGYDHCCSRDTVAIDAEYVLCVSCSTQPPPTCIVDAYVDHGIFVAHLSSRCCRYFDIDWLPPILRDCFRLLAPSLGDTRVYFQNR